MRFRTCILIGGLLLSACDSLQMGFPLATPKPGQNPAAPPFRCGGVNSVISFSKGTDSDEGEIKLANLSTAMKADVFVSPRTSPAGIAETLMAACTQAGLRCGFQGYSAVKVCGAINRDWTFSITQASFSHTDNPND